MGAPSIQSYPFRMAAPFLRHSAFKKASTAVALEAAMSAGGLGRRGALAVTGRGRVATCSLLDEDVYEYSLPELEDPLRRPTLPVSADRTFSSLRAQAADGSAPALPSPPPGE